MATAPLGWRIRRSFWTRWQTLRFGLNKPLEYGPPDPDRTSIGTRPLGEIQDGIPLRSVVAFDRLPVDESGLGMRALVGLGLFLNKVVPPMKTGLPEIDDEIGEAVEEAVPRRYRKSFRAPAMPDVYAGSGTPDLAELAVRSPYSVFLEHGDGDRLQWDFRMLGDFEHHDGLCSLSLRVLFAVDGTSGELAATQIESEAFGSVRPDDHAWSESSRLAVCAASTHMALTRHYNYVHLVGGDHWAVATRNHLPPDHPLFILLWPHIFHSLYTNYGTARTQLLPDGDFVNIYSFTHAGLMAYYDAMYERYDVRITDPDADWTRRGLDGARFEHPSHDNLRELSAVLNDHARRYIEAYYTSDEALRDDAAVVAWMDALDELIPNGIAPLAGGELTREGLARLAAGHIYEGSVVHDLAGTTLWDYQLWADRNPPRMYADGRRIPVDVYQRMIDNNYALQIKRAPLLADYGSVALDATGRQLFARFHADCTALQEQYDRTPAGPWRMEPENLEIGMNA